MTFMISKAERSFIQTGLVSNQRQDGRGLYEFRPVALETGVAPLANGSARLSIDGGTEVLAATKLDVVEEDGGQISCTVSCSPAAYPNLSTAALDDLQYDMTVVLNQTLSHPSLHPSNLTILPKKKGWLLNLDLVVLSDAGNVYDALFMAARAALCDTKVPRTRSVEYKARKTAQGGDMDVDQDTSSGFDTRSHVDAADFELPDYWDEGEVLGGGDNWPVCVTLNVVSATHYLDATLQEEACTPTRLLLIYSFPSQLQGIRTLGPGELDLSHIKELIQSGEKYAHQLFKALNAKLQEEDLRRNQKARDRFAKR